MSFARKGSHSFWCEPGFPASTVRVEFRNRTPWASIAPNQSVGGRMSKAPETISSRMTESCGFVPVSL